MSRYMLIRRLRGPVFLLLVGVIALLAQSHILSWWKSWPLFLILAGVLALAERAALAAEGGIPPNGYPANPGYPNQAYPNPADPYAAQYGSPYPPQPSAAPAWTNTAQQVQPTQQPGSAIVPAGHDVELVKDPRNYEGGQS